MFVEKCNLGSGFGQFWLFLLAGFRVFADFGSSLRVPVTPKVLMFLEILIKQNIGAMTRNGA